MLSPKATKSGLRAVRKQLGAGRREISRQLEQLAPDTRERHLIVGELLDKPAAVLDVGGVPKQLSAVLLDGTPCVAANTEPPADFLIPFGPLPFGDRCVEAIASLDVLEHVPPAERKRFVSELLRVADRRVVLSCPYGSPEHTAAEKEIADWLAERAGGQRNRWIDEHIGNGLPVESELRGLFATEEFTTEFFYHGDFRKTVRAFRRDVEARANAHMKRVYATWAGTEPDTRLASEPTPHTNRVFVRAIRA